MRVPRKVVFIIVLTDTVCSMQKACREMCILLQILTLGSSDYILIEQTHIFPSYNRQIGPRVLSFHFRSNDREWICKKTGKFGKKQNT